MPALGWPDRPADPGAKEEHRTVDQQTRTALKHDKFVDTTSHGLEWASANRKPLIMTLSIIIAVIAIAAIGALIYNNREDAAAAAFGQAIEVYQAPLTAPGQTAPPGMKTFPSAAERAKAANAQFVAVADKYGMTPDGRMARYFAGVTYMEAGQTQAAEDALKKAAEGWNKNIAALAKMALAQLYRNTGRDAQAIELYNDVSAHPTTTVPYGMAQLQLAELYQNEGKTDQAKKVYATLKDKDPKGPAGQIAAEKLNPAPAGRSLGLQQ